MPEAVISVVGVTKRFGELVAVDDLAFDVTRGSTTALLATAAAVALRYCSHRITCRKLSGFATLC